MAKRIFCSLIFAAMASAVAPAAFAELQPFQNDASAYDVVSNCNTVDACFASAGTYGAADMSSCTSSYHCYTCASDASNAVPHVMCVAISISASCSCTLKQSGTSWTCSWKGSCRYRP